MVIKSIKIIKGWNLVAFPTYNTNIQELIKDERILVLKNLTDSYNSSVPSFFNTLSKLDNKIGYFLKASENFDLKIDGELLDYSNLTKEEKTMIINKINEIDNSAISSKNIKLSKGWNLVAFPLYNINLQNIINNKRILTLKNLTDSYDSSVPSFFNTLTKLDNKVGYFLKASEDFELKIDGELLDYSNLTKQEKDIIINKIGDNSSNTGNTGNTGNGDNKQRLKLNVKYSLEIILLSDFIRYDFVFKDDYTTIKYNEKTDTYLGNLSQFVDGEGEENMDLFKIIDYNPITNSFIVKPLLFYNLINLGRLINLSETPYDINGTIKEIKIEDTLNVKEITILDSNFRKYLVNNYNAEEKDSKIKINTDSVDYINLYSINIKSIEGIENFNNLKYLNCEKTNISKLDLTNNLELMYLNCNETKIFNLDVTKNKKLKYLHCKNTNISKLDVTNNIELRYLRCDKTKIVELDLTNNIDLRFLDCEENSISKLDITKNTKLTELNFRDTKVSNIVINNNKIRWIASPIQLETTKYTDLIVLDFQGTFTTKVDVTNNTELRYLHCEYTNISNLDVTKNTKLKGLYCDEVKISKLDVTNNTELEILFVDKTNITELDVTKNTELKVLSCVNTNISELNVTNNTKLTELWCNNTKISELDLTKNTELIEYLGCNNTMISELDVTKNTKLIELHCDNTMISELDVTNNTKLTELWCNNTMISELDVTKNTKLIELHCNNTMISELDVTNNTELLELHCYITNISKLDLTKNTKLTELWCFETKISKLDLTKNTKLTELYANENLKTIYVKDLNNIPAGWNKSTRTTYRLK